MAGRAWEELRIRVCVLGIRFLDRGSDFWTEIGCLDWDSGSWTGIRGLGLTVGCLGLTFRGLGLTFGSWIDILSSWMCIFGLLG